MVSLKKQVSEILDTCGIHVFPKECYDTKLTSSRKIKCHYSCNDMEKFVKMESKLKEVFGDKIIKIHYCSLNEVVYKKLGKDKLVYAHYGKDVKAYFGDNVQVYFKL